MYFNCTHNIYIVKEQKVFQQLHIFPKNTHISLPYPNQRITWYNIKLLILMTLKLSIVSYLIVIIIPQFTWNSIGIELVSYRVCFFWEEFMQPGLSKIPMQTLILQFLISLM